jgi:hypothetical protein
MKVLIINTTIDETKSSRSLNGIDSAITFELYIKYRCNANPCHLHITANHLWSKYTFIDEKTAYIGSFDSMDKVLEKNPFMGNVLILTHEQWLDKQNPDWRTNPRYKYW